MNTRRFTVPLRAWQRSVQRALARLLRRPAARAADAPADAAAAPAPFGAERTLSLLALLSTLLRGLAITGLAAGTGWLLVHYPPVRSIAPGEVGLRTNQVTGSTSQWRDGSVWVVPVLHDLRTLSLGDRAWRADDIAQAQGPAPLQSVEGLSLGVDLVVRYAPDPAQASRLLRQRVDDLGDQIVAPAVQGIVYKVYARYTVREAFSSKRADIQQQIEAELKPRLAADGLLLRAVHLGRIDLPPDYRRGMEGLLAEELATQKMQYTLDLKAKRVKETELEASAEKARREVQAEAAAREQVIAARGQEEAMKHVLPFKQRQIEQRKLEAEAEKQARVRAAEGSAEARRIEAAGEADARQKLAEAEAWRLEKIGRVNAEQMAREGSVISQHPLLIQKALADKLSDKVQVIVAPPPAGGNFISDALAGGRVATKH